MSDYDKLKQVFTQLEIGFVEISDENSMDIVCKQGAEKISGYGDFLTIFRFNHDGTFIEMGAYE